jgi:hypothetical protein
MLNVEVLGLLFALGIYCSIASAGVPLVDIGKIMDMQDSPGGYLACGHKRDACGSGGKNIIKKTCF